MQDGCSNERAIALHFTAGTLVLRVFFGRLGACSNCSFLVGILASASLVSFFDKGSWQVDREGEAAPSSRFGGKGAKPTNAWCEPQQVENLIVFNCESCARPGCCQNVDA